MLPPLIKPVIPSNESSRTGADVKRLKKEEFRKGNPGVGYEKGRKTNFQPFSSLSFRDAQPMKRL
jgi:hypothetical protein